MENYHDYINHLQNLFKEKLNEKLNYSIEAFIKLLIQVEEKGVTLNDEAQSVFFQVNLGAYKFR